jgi:hypothetical protein
VRDRLRRAFVCAAILAAVFTFASPRAAEANELALLAGDPPGATCYHFVLITVCCDGGGCYILR